MPQSTLFIPDISGFTRFIKENEIEHSQHIIEELLSILIQVGKKHFQLAEVEGDALFFYQYQQVLTKEQLEEIARKMYQAFHRHLQLYEHKRICNCSACTQAIDLRLKFIVHVGEVTLAKIGKKDGKPFGSPVIAVHRLLKNQIPEDEYILMTREALQGIQTPNGFLEGKKHDQDLGDLHYAYRLIDDWLPEFSPADSLLVQQKIDMEVESSGIVQLGVEDLFELVSELKHRKAWNKDAEEILFEEGEINKEGTGHFCVIKGESFYFDTVKPKQEQTKWAYGEVLRDPDFFKYIETDFLLFPINEKETEIRFCFKIAFKWKFHYLLYPIFWSKLSKQANHIVKSLQLAAPTFALQKVA